MTAAGKSLRAGGLIAAALAWSACGSGVQEPTADDGVALEIGDVRIEMAELEPLLRYLDELDSTMGANYRMRELLDRHVLPMHLARKAFAAERAAALAEAEALHSVAGNYRELVAKGALTGGDQPELPWNRNQLPLPVAEFAFRYENLGRASPPIETAFGYTLIAGENIVPGTTSVGDLLHAFVVDFNTHEPSEFYLWLERAKQELASEPITRVAPALRDALPLWLKKP